MSAEGKKKRGASGVMNAKMSAWRGNGRAPDWMARAVGAFRTQPAPSSGSTFMRGLLGGVIVQALGRGNMVGDYEKHIQHAQTRVTDLNLIID